MTKPNQEAVAACNLARQGYDYYYPRLRQVKPDGSVAIEPLFRRYLFIFSDGRWYSLRSTRGMSHVLMGEGGPQAVSEAIIASLKAREGKDGLIRLPKPEKFSPGQTLKVESGFFAGQFAVFVTMTPHERCKVLLSWLGRSVTTDVDSRLLVAV